MAIADTSSSSVWIEQAVGHPVTGELDKADALALTAKIKAYVGVTWVLIAAAHERKAYKALGYKTWAEYVEAEFDMSRSRAYQLISQARVVLEISEAVSTMVDISEREARDLAPVIDDAKAAAAAAVDALPEDADEDERRAAVAAALEGVRPSAPAKPARYECSVCADSFTRPVWHCDRCGSHWDDGYVCATCAAHTVGVDTDTGEKVDPSPAPTTKPKPQPTPEEQAANDLAARIAESDAGYRAAVSRETSKTRDGLLKLDPARASSLCLPDDRSSAVAFVADVRDWLDTYERGLRSTNLRSVQ